MKHCRKETLDSKQLVPPKFLVFAKLKTTLLIPVSFTEKQVLWTAAYNL